jgi:hypothetical protein
MKKRITPAFVLAMLALFVALAGTATAGTAAVMITGKQIKNGSIGLADLSASAKRALKGQRGPRGYTGVQGIQGAQGTQGASGANGGFDPNKILYVTGPTVTVPAGDLVTITTPCPSGSKALSGGYVDINAGNGTVWASRTYDSGGSWTVQVENFNGTIDDSATGYAICAAR